MGTDKIHYWSIEPPIMYMVEKQLQTNNDLSFLRKVFIVFEELIIVG